MMLAKSLTYFLKCKIEILALDSQDYCKYQRNRETAYHLINLQLTFSYSFITEGHSTLFLQQTEFLLYGRQKSLLRQIIKCFDGRLRFRHSPAEIGESLEILELSQGMMRDIFKD